MNARWTWIVAACLGPAAPGLAQEGGSVDERLAEQDRRIEELAGELGARGRAGYDGGFTIEDSSGDNRLTIEGLLQVNSYTFLPDEAGRESGFDLRRMRLELLGTIDGFYRFALEPKFTVDEFEFEEAWIGADLGEQGPRLHVGRMKEPFGLEEMLPRKHIDFAEFSILNQLMPAEDLGLTLLGKTSGGALEYGLAFYNGTGAEELNTDKDVAARLVWHPFAPCEDSLLQGLQFGAAGTFGRADEDLSGEELDTETRMPFLAFEPGSELDGERTRLGLEALWVGGPASVSGELVHVEQDMLGPASAGGADPVSLSGWYVAASWVLTGEEKTIRGVKPARPLARDKRGAGPGWGAWQLAARFSELSLDDELVALGLVAPAAFPDRVHTLDLGLNWYATEHARVKLHYVHTSYADRITISGDQRDSEDAVLVQFQLTF